MATVVEVVGVSVDGGERGGRVESVAVVVCEAAEGRVGVCAGLAHAHRVASVVSESALGESTWLRRWCVCVFSRSVRVVYHA